MNTWDHLTEQAYRLLTRSRRADLTPAVTLVQSLHKQPPSSPAAICAHLGTASTALPQLARYARSGDRHALLMAAVLMRHPLRRIANRADPDGYCSTDSDARDNATLAVFFEIIRTAPEPQLLNSRYLYNKTLRKTLEARPAPVSPDVATRVDPHSQTLDRPDFGTDYDHTANLLQLARDRRIITALEHDTLRTLYLNSDVFSPSSAARTLGANVSAVERRAQRAIRKLCTYYDSEVAA